MRAFVFVCVCVCARASVYVRERACTHMVVSVYVRVYVHVVVFARTCVRICVGGLLVLGVDVMHVEWYVSQLEMIIISVI